MNVHLWGLRHCNTGVQIFGPQALARDDSVLTFEHASARWAMCKLRIRPGIEVFSVVGVLLFAEGFSHLVECRVDLLIILDLLPSDALLFSPFALGSLLHLFHQVVLVGLFVLLSLVEDVTQEFHRVVRVTLPCISPCAASEKRLRQWQRCYINV